MVEPAAAEPGAPIRHTDFRIGGVFWSSGRRWRCTDIGTRVIVAIRLDKVQVQTAPSGEQRTLDETAAEAEGWFNGPPYAVAESVFDEYAIEGCTLEPDTDEAMRHVLTMDEIAAYRAERARARGGSE